MLVAAIEEIVAATARGRKLRVGIGDDAAVWKPSRSAESVITTDALVEDVHFTRDGMTAAEVGYRALASNLSDIAAMGARPVLATIALGVSRTVQADWILDCYRGMAGLAQTSRTALAGGDIVRAPAILLSITVVGEVRPSNRKTRDGARPGDVLAVTGPLGASRAGLEIVLRHSGLLEDPRLAGALAAYRTPRPRLREGLRLGASRDVHAMMDLSDGLSTDLRRMCAASGVGAVVDAVPIAAAAQAVAGVVASADPQNEARAYALHGGEDFELLIAVAPRAFDHLSLSLQRSCGRGLHRIGRITEGSSVGLQNGEQIVELAGSGWDHLRNER